MKKVLPPSSRSAFGSLHGQTYLLASSYLRPSARISARPADHRPRPRGGPALPRHCARSTSPGIRESGGPPHVEALPRRRPLGLGDDAGRLPAPRASGTRARAACRYACRRLPRQDRMEGVRLHRTHSRRPPAGETRGRSAWPARELGRVRGRVSPKAWVGPPITRREHVLRKPAPAHC